MKKGKTGFRLKQFVRDDSCRAREMVRALTAHGQLSSNSQSQCQNAGRVPVHLWPQCCGRGGKRQEDDWGLLAAS